MERSGQHWLMDSTQGLSLVLNDLLTVQTENLDLIWLPCDQHNDAIFRNALGQMKVKNSHFHLHYVSVQLPCIAGQRFCHLVATVGL